MIEFRVPRKRDACLLLVWAASACGTPPRTIEPIALPDESEPTKESQPAKAPPTPTPSASAAAEKTALPPNWVRVACPKGTSPGTEPKGSRCICFGDYGAKDFIPTAKIECPAGTVVIQVAPGDGACEYECGPPPVFATSPPPPKGQAAPHPFVACPKGKKPWVVGKSCQERRRRATPTPRRRSPTKIA